MRIPQKNLDYFMRHDVQKTWLSASEIVFVRYLQAERQKVEELQAQLDAVRPSAKQQLKE